MTARASTRRSAPVAITPMRTTNGASSRPVDVTLSIPARVTASTVAPRTRCGAIAGCAASGAR